MGQVAVEKVKEEEKTLPIFSEIAKRFEEVKRRAFGLFEKRGFEHGQDIDDWLKAERELFGWSEAELSEKDGVYHARISLPGFEAKDIEVTATPSEILMRASVKEEKKEEKDNISWTEFGSSDVCRRFGMANPIDPDRVTAHLENGVLDIEAPQAATPKEMAAKAG